MNTSNAVHRSSATARNPDRPGLDPDRPGLDLDRPGLDPDRPTEPPPPPPPNPPDPPMGYIPEPDEGGFNFRFAQFATANFDPAKWVAALGVLLLLSAGIAVLSSQWQTLNEAGRLGILIVATALLAVVAQRLAERAPATADVAFIGVAVMSALDIGGAVVVGGGGWPAATMAVGMSGLAIAEFLRRRRPSPAADVLFVAAGVALAAGAAALTAIPVAVVLGGLGVLSWLAVDRRWACGSWALLTALSPLALAFVETGIPGVGTMERLGLLGVEHGWAAAVGGVLAALSFGLLVASERDARYALASLGSIVLGVATAWSAYQPPALYALYIAAALFLLVEVASVLVPRTFSAREVLDRSLQGIEVVVGSIITLSVLLQLVELTSRFGAYEANGPLMATAIVTGLAWLVAGFRYQRIEFVGLANGMAVTALLFAVVDPTAIGLSQVFLGLGLAIWGYRTHLAYYGAGLGLVVLGGWTMLVDLGVSAPEFYVWLPMLMWFLLGGAAQMPTAARWALPAGVITVVHLLGHLAGDSTIHLTTLVAAAVVLAAVGGWRAERAPLLCGAVIATAVGLYQVIDVTVGVAGWGWLAVGGSSLIALAALIEYTAKWESPMPLP